ncbi:MAG: ATP-binding protein [Methylococcales bacterium]
MLRRHEPAALLIVASYRPEDAFRNRHPVESVRQEAHVHDRCVEIPLDTLAAADVAVYLGRRFEGWRIVDGVAQAVHRRSGAHPLFMVKLLDYLVGQGGFQTGAECSPDREDVLTAGVPQDLRQLIAYQFERLGNAEQELLGAASVAGAEWSAALVAALMEQPVDAIESIGEALVRGRQWLRPAGIDEWPDGTVAGRFAFGHALYEEILYQKVTPARKILWHRRSGERLAAAWGTRVEELAAAIALHFERARDYPRAIGYLRLAAQHSARRFANQEALHYLDRALELLGPRPGETRLDILQQTGAVRRGMGNMEGAIGVLETMLECARTLGHGIGEVRALIDLSRAYFWIDRRRTLDLAVEAVACSERLNNPIIQHLAMTTRAGMGFYLQGWQDHYAEICRDALAAARRLNNPVILNTRLSFHTMLETYASNYRLADKTADEGVGLAESLGDGYLFMVIRYFQSWSLLHLGDWGKASRLINEGLQAAERNENIHGIRSFIAMKALLHCEALDFEGALALCGQAAPLLNQRPDVTSTCLFWIVSGKAHLGLGDSTRALGCLEAVIGRAEDMVMDWLFYLPLHCTFCECWLAQGDRMRARQHAQRLRELAERPPERSYLVT